MYSIQRLFLLAMLTTSVFSQPLLAAETKGEIAIELQVASSEKTDSLSATAFGISLAHWYETTGEISSLPLGIVEPGYDALLHGFTQQIQIWREMSEREPIVNRYMDELLAIEDADFLGPYIWENFRNREWNETAAPKNIERFRSWAKRELIGHKPRIEAVLNVRRKN